jgi:trigger factor
MQVVIEKLSGLQRRLKITVEKEKVAEAYQEKLKNVAKTAAMKGFRPGKAPMNVIESRYSKAICQELAGDLMQESFEDALKQHDLRVAGQPHVHPQPVKPNVEFEYEATFEVYPEISLKDFKDVDFEKVVSEIASEDVEKVIDKIRTKHADWKTVTRAAKEGDKAEIDFEGFIDDKAFEGGKAEHFSLELGSKQMIPGFEEGIIGKNPGDKFDIKVNFPEKYPVQDLAGKEATFKITLHEVQEATLPSVDEEFLKKVGFGDKSVEDFKAHVKNSLEKELEQLIENKFKTQVFEKLLDLNAIEIPEALIKLEISNLQNMARSQMAMQQGKKEIPNVELPSEPFQKQANRRVSLGLLIGEIIRLNDIKADPKKVRAKIEEMANAYPNADQIVEMYLQNERLINEIESLVLEEQAIAKLLENAKIQEKPLKYESFVEWVQQGGDDL